MVAVLRSAMQDRRLSYRARGILGAVLSRPDDWRTDTERLAAESSEGERAVGTALQQLARYGYLRREKVRDARGRLSTEWVLTDDPSLISTEPQLPRAGSPRAGSPRAEKPRGLLEIETEEVTPPPTPPPERASDALADELVVVVVNGIGETRPPAPRTLRAECRRLAAGGWTPEALAHSVRGHDWTGARAGAVIAWLRDQPEHPPSRPVAHRERPEWCGTCDPSSRRLLDAQGRPRARTRCPNCHPGRNQP